MNRSTIAVGVLLLVSVSINIGFIFRGRDRRAPDSPGPAVRSSAPPPGESADPPPLRPPRPEPPTEPSRLSEPIQETAPRRPASIPLPSRMDPRVARIIDEQEEFKIFWQDLGKVFAIQERLDPEEYLQIIVAGTSDFLKLREPLRSQFLSQVRFAIAEREQARKEYDEARKALPAKDKNNPSLFAAERQAIDTRYQSKLKASEGRIGPFLDPGQVRHQEFSGKLPKWLRELEPIAP